jgi:hypothetical protein
VSVLITSRSNEIEDSIWWKDYVLCCIFLFRAYDLRCDPTATRSAENIEDILLPEMQESIIFY